MHMISKKDLSKAEMDTLTKSCSPTIVIIANGEVQTHGEATVYVTELDIFLTVKVLEHTPAVLSFGKLCDENGYSYEWINGQKPHLIKNGIRIQCNTENFVPIVVPGLSASSSSTSPTTTVSSDSETREKEDLSGIDSHPVPVSSSHVEEMIEREETRCVLTSRSGCKNSEKNLVDDEVLERRDSHASSSHEPSLEPTPSRSEDLGKHTVETHFPKDRNCEICQRTKITRAPCRRRNGGAVSRA